MDCLCQGHAGCIKAVNFSQHAKAGGPGIQPVRSILTSNKAPIVSKVWDSIPIWETYIYIYVYVYVYIYIYIYLFLGSRGPIILTGLPVLLDSRQGLASGVALGALASHRAMGEVIGTDWVGNVDPE